MITTCIGLACHLMDECVASPFTTIATWGAVPGSALAMAGFLMYRRSVADGRAKACRCVRCGYDLSATPGVVCPECGSERPPAA